LHDFHTQLYHWIESFGFPVSAIVRLVLAAVCGALIGLEREIRGREAGFRTNLLVCLGCAIIMIVSLQVGMLPWPTIPGRSITVDPARIAYATMAGIGFLGAGAIVKHGSDVRGLTTAAGIWCVAAIGLGAGQGLYFLVIIATALVLLALWGLSAIEKIVPRTHFRTVIVRRTWEDNCIAETVEHVRSAGFKVDNWEFERSADLRFVEIKLHVGFRDKHHFDNMEKHLPLDGKYELVAVRQE
jgi:putative Mg2+ transporter-C (MgtC) family protein